MDSILDRLTRNIELPEMIKIQQIFPRESIENIPLAVKNEIDKKPIASAIKKDAQIAITVGSRGIHDILPIIKEVVANVKTLGAQPFIIPAMGSHGGATAEGQIEVLEGLGITEETIGVPVKATMEVVKIGKTHKGQPVFIDRYAAEADGIIIVNRIKPHTAFRGDYESGLMKMMTIGLGKQKGAETCHFQGFYKMAENITLFGKAILKYAPILFGIGIIENAYDETCEIIALKPEEIPLEEPRLLKKARSLMPQIKLDPIDVLIVDEIGKEISGNGMDPNITGTFNPKVPAEGGPEVQRVVLLDLTNTSHGNANGIGFSDFITQRLYDKIDFEKIYANAMTSRAPASVRTPIVAANDLQAIKAAIQSCTDINIKNPRIVRIKNSAYIDEIYVSKAFLEEAREKQDILFKSNPQTFKFDKDGNLMMEEGQ